MTKTITFAIMHFTVAFTVAYLLTGNLMIGGAIAMIEPLVNTVGYYFHERIWATMTHQQAQADEDSSRSASHSLFVGHSH